ncbi:MAG: MFS transporter, partial [Sinomonas sp.]|nr:MFS transporter [Sinomonas sp.]
AAVLPWSFVADRIGRGPAMTAGVAAATALGLLAPLAPTTGVLLTLRCLEGIALGAVPALAVAYLNEEVHKAHAALAAGTYVAGTTVGGLLGRLVAGPISDAWGWRPAVFAVSVLGAVSAAAFVALAPRQQGFIPLRKRPGASPRGLRAGFSHAAALLTAQLRSRRLLALYAQAFTLMGGFVAIYNFLGFRLELPPYGLPAAMTSLLFLSYFSGTFSSGFAARLSEKYGRGRVMVASMALMALGALLTVLDSLPAILIGLLAFTAGFFAAHGLGSGWTGALASSGRAQAASLYNLGYYAGSSLIGWLGGVAFQSFGWGWLAIGVAALSLGTAAMAAAVHPKG